MDGRLDPEERLRQYCRLKVSCAKCGGTGLIRWDRLDGLLHCRGCLAWYRMLGDGRLVPTAAPPPSVRVSVRSGMGGWQDHRVPGVTGPAPGPARGSALRPVLWGLVPVLAVVIAAILRPAPSHSNAPPRSLEARAWLLARSWLDRDVSQMVRLTDAAQDRALRRWISQTPPPDRSGRSGRRDRGITLAIRHQDARTAEVLVQVMGAAGAEGGPCQELHLCWQVRQGDWYFVPALQEVKGSPHPPPRTRSEVPRARATGQGRPAPSRSRAGSSARKKALPS